MNKIKIALALIGIVALAVAVSRCGDKASDKRVNAPAETVSSEYGAKADTDAPSETKKNNIIPDREERELPASALIDFEPVMQLPELPTGCEITSVTALLNHYGFDVSKMTMADDYMERSDPGKCTFNDAFVGSPYDPDAWGCYAPVVYRAAKKYLSEQDTKYKPYEITGCDPDNLYRLVADETPVAVWVSISLVEPFPKYYWTTKDGTKVTFMVNEHCVVLTGYDKNSGNVTVADPLKGTIEYNMELFEQRYDQLGKQAVCIADWGQE